MWVSLAAVSLLAAAKPGPRGPADFDTAVYVPRVERAADFGPFLAEGSRRTVVLRSESWRDEFHPLMHIDITRPEDVANSGLDPTGAATLVFRGTERFSCTSLKDVKKFQERCFETLKTLGDPWKETVDGVTLVGAKDVLGRVLGAYALKGTEACAVGTQANSAERAVREAATWLGKPAVGPLWASMAGLTGTAYVVRRQGAVGIRPEGLTTVWDARGSAPMDGLTTGGPSPFAQVPNGGLLTLKLRAAPGALLPALESVARFLERLCPACELAPFMQTAHALAPTLSGNAVLQVQKIKVQASLRTEAGRFFSVRTALLAESLKPDESKKAIDLMMALHGAKALNEGDGVSLLLREGELRLGVRDGVVFLANDAQALDALRKVSGNKAGKQAHGAELWIDPNALANGLAQVPLLDAVSSPELAGILAGSAELGPLLLSTQQIAGWADAAGSGSYRAQMVYRLKQPPAAPDAGTNGRSARDGGP